MEHVYTPEEFLSLEHLQQELKQTTQSGHR
jgi:hypothetical protein